MIKKTFILLAVSMYAAGLSKAQDFTLGADISWETEMEAKGYTFANANGEARECTVLMKELGLNAVRLRVWVNPTNGYCGKQDVLNKALRAKQAGMDIMIDFHYSDSWADPGKQNIPAVWKNQNLRPLRKHPRPMTLPILRHIRKIEYSAAYHLRRAIILPA